jgi:hypothetical protein
MDVVLILKIISLIPWALYYILLFWTAGLNPTLCTFNLLLSKPSPNNPGTADDVKPNYWLALALGELFLKAMEMFLGMGEKSSSSSSISIQKAPVFDMLLLTDKVATCFRLELLLY